MQQRIIANHANRITSAGMLTASTLRPSSAHRLVSRTRAGGGDVALVGAYTGAVDTSVEVEIVSGTGTALRPSAPVLTGVGSGALSVLALDAGAVPETVTLRLVSTGSRPRAAEYPFFGAVLRAREPGTAGNALTMTVTRRLTLTPTDYSALAEIPAGTADLEGPQWDWGAAVGTDDQIPPTAPRLALEGGAQVHRHWRTWEGDRWVWHLDPAPVGRVAVGTRVLAVAGDYRLTLSDGATSETYDAVTVFEALQQIAGRSALVEVVGAVAEDRAPGGMAVTDVPLRTDAYAMPVEATLRGAYGVPRLDAVTVAPDAPTELITLTRLGSGRWSVAGSVSGALAEAMAGRPYSGGPVGFTIPAASIPASEQGDAVARVSLVARDPGATRPAVCVSPRLGRAATPATVTFRYERRPGGTCSCEGLPMPYLSDACLGWAGEEADMSLAPAVRERVDAVYAWRRAVAAAQTRWVPHVAAHTLYVGAQPGQYRVRATAVIQYDVGGVNVGWSAVGYVRQVWSDPALAEGPRATINGYSSDPSGADWSYSGIAIGGYAVDIVNFPPQWSPAKMTAQPTWTAAIETLVPAVAGTPVAVAEQVAGWRGADEEFAAMDAMVDIILPTLAQVHATPAALTAWDALWAEAQAEMDSRIASSPDNDARLLNQAWLRRYADACDQIRTLAGIYPSFESASTGRACWQDDPDAAYWWVDTSGQYLPAFSNRAWVSARRLGEQITPTYEFGFSLRVACEANLQEGDSFSVTLRGAMGDGYEVGDEYRLPLVAAAPAIWAGGAAGDDTHTWAVRGSASGAAPDWLWRPSAPTDYLAGPVHLRLDAGGIAYAPGDTWSVALEGGSLRWRRDGGAWSTADLFGAAPDLGAGLSLAVSAGAAPSFAAGDTWTFSAPAAHGPARLLAPREGQGWAWDGASATLDLDLGAVGPVGLVLLALHSLPAGCTIGLSGGDAAIGEWSATGTWAAGPVVLELPAGRSARYLRLALGGCGAGASVGWLWVGSPWAPSTAAAAVSRTYTYELPRGGGRNPRGVYRGRGLGARWSWALDSGAPLLGADIAGLVALLDHVAAAGGEYVALLPDATAPALLAQLDTDAVTLTEHPGWAMTDGSAMFDVELPWRGVLV